jgi:hypothetical protein
VLSTACFLSKNGSKEQEGQQDKRTLQMISFDSFRSSFCCDCAGFFNNKGKEKFQSLGCANLSAGDENKSEGQQEKYVTYYNGRSLCHFAYFLILLHNLFYPCLFKRKERFVKTSNVNAFTYRERKRTGLQGIRNIYIDGPSKMLLTTGNFVCLFLFFIFGVVESESSTFTCVYGRRIQTEGEPGELAMEWANI